eukprot:TRINITY_DN67520_c6_g1_i1.p1 TRINITY_DN67520_c6_g1~~TRINITY_DN67520_c6_g1_i1.p1  ORF type:complete len:209 (-),score=103.43 TRINITY_DN67520_c6_g1_i1:650-1276(-)
MMMMMRTLSVVAAVVVVAAVAAVAVGGAPVGDEHRFPVVPTGVLQKRELSALGKASNKGRKLGETLGAKSRDVDAILMLLGKYVEQTGAMYAAGSGSGSASSSGSASGASPSSSGDGRIPVFQDDNSHRNIAFVEAGGRPGDEHRFPVVPTEMMLRQRYSTPRKAIDELNKRIGDVQQVLEKLQKASAGYTKAFGDAGMLDQDMKKKK